MKRLMLFHHDPENDDAFIDGLVEKARQEFPNVSAASEGAEIHLPQEESARQVLVTDHERRVERRYHVELPVRLSWKGPDGQTRTATGVSRNISRSGIYFIAPRDLNFGSPLDMNLVVPDEITHRGDTHFEYRTRPVRQVDCNGVLGSHVPSLGIGARLSPAVEAALAS